MRNELVQLVDEIRQGVGSLADRHDDNAHVMQEIVALNKRISALTLLLRVHLELDHDVAFLTKQDEGSEKT